MHENERLMSKMPKRDEEKESHSNSSILGMKGTDMGKSQNRYTSVADLVENISDDHSFNKSVEERVRSRQIVKTLVALRTAKGISQTQIATQLKCGQSRISKIENGVDADLSFGDVEAYGQVLGRELEISLMPQGMSLTDEVKFYAFQMKHRLDALTELAGEDRKLAEGIAGFLGEAFFNLVGMLNDSASRLPSDESDRPYIRVRVEELSDEPTVCDTSEHPTLPMSPSVLA